MGPLAIDRTAQDLLDSVQAGRVAELGGGRVDAELIRRLVLGLPFGEPEGSIRSAVRRLLGDLRAPCECALTPVGISIQNAVIEGEIELRSATGAEGGPMCPLSFEQCTFHGRFVGAQARFSRLSFTECRFADPGVDGAPTIELSGGAIDRDLHMRGNGPEGLDSSERRPATQGPYLWLRLNGVRIGGELDLCGSRFRAPPTGERRRSEDANDALDLTLAEIAGDIQCHDVQCEGRFKMRTAHVGGDVWMSGARFENPGAQAMLIQGTRIDGFLMMDGAFVNADQTGAFRRFECTGTLKLEASEIGRSFYLEDAIVRGAIEGRTLSVKDDLVLHAQITGGIDLGGARIGGSFDLSKLNLASPIRRVSLKDVSIGQTLKVAQPDVPYQLVDAREIELRGLKPLKLVETLWRLAPGGKDEREGEVPLERRLVQVAFLVDDSHPRDVRIFHLDGHADVIRRALERCGGGRRASAAGRAFDRVTRRRPRTRWQTRERRAAIIRLKDCYLLRRNGFRGRDESECRLENGFHLPPRMPTPELRLLVARRDWFAPCPLGAPRRYEPHRWTKERFGHHVESNPLLQADFDLEGAACDLLDDQGGRAWGEHLDRISINHFTYRRWSWVAEARTRSSETGIIESVRKWLGRWKSWACWIPRARYSWQGGKAGFLARLDNWDRAAWADRPTGRGHADEIVQTNTRRSSLQWLYDRLKGGLADWLWPLARGGMATRLREESDYLEPWQLRRNWIYRQFTPLPRRLEGLSSVSRYRVSEAEYRPQPFEQAVTVARAEGREDVAASFEMLKRRLEWRLFNKRIRWLLAGPAITLGALWLVAKEGRWLQTGTALLMTIFMMAIISSIDNLLRNIHVPWCGRVLSDWNPVRKGVRNLLLWAPALILLFFGDPWSQHPFHFIVSLSIFLCIRFISVFAHAWMRFGFGYLRRPVRAINMLILAFLIGWGGVRIANRNDMLVIASQPTAQVAVRSEELKDYPVPGKKLPEGKPLIPGMSAVEPGPDLVTEISCRPTLSEPLYALDVLIPLVDLHEESRCEVRRVRADQAPAPSVRGMSWRELADNFPGFLIKDHRFWWWMKALYAIAGWFIVSLSLLTFAQVNRTHGEAAESE